MRVRPSTSPETWCERNRKHQVETTRILLLARDEADALQWQLVDTVTERGQLAAVMAAWVHDHEPPLGLYRAERDDGTTFELEHTEGDRGSTPSGVWDGKLSAKSRSKARRLRDEGGVREVTEARTFLVRGDHATYTVTLTGDTVKCSCPAFGACSHGQAVRLAANEPARDSTRDGGCRP